MKHCPKISPSTRNVKTLQTSTETIRVAIQIDWSMPYDVKLPTPTTVVTSVFQSANSLSDGKHACPMDPSDNVTFTRLPQSPGRPLAHIPNRIKPCLS